MQIRDIIDRLKAGCYVYHRQGRFDSFCVGRFIDFHIASGCTITSRVFHSLIEYNIIEYDRTEPNSTMFPIDRYKFVNDEIMTPSAISNILKKNPK